MEKLTQPFETEGHDLSGMASLEFNDQETITSFVSMIPGMDLNRFEPVAMKLFVTEEAPVLTLYAKLKEDTTSKSKDGKVPVRKFKTSLQWPDLFKFVKYFDLVVHDGKFNL